MGDGSDVERLLEAYKITERAARDAERLTKQAKKGSVWKPLLASVLTFAGAAIGGSFAAGRFFEQESAKIDKIDRIEKQVEQHENRLTEAFNLCVKSQGCCDLQCHRLDALTNVRLCP